MARSKQSPVRILLLAQRSGTLAKTTSKELDNIGEKKQIPKTTFRVLRSRLASVCYFYYIESPWLHALKIICKTLFFFIWTW